MPIIRFHGVNSKELLPQAAELQTKLADLFQTPPDNITLECLLSVFIAQGTVIEKAYPMVEILSFRRSSEIESACAALIFQQLQQIGYPHSDIFYNYLPEEGYYVDGVRF